MKNETVQFTRADYMANRCTHRQYYAQFVTSYVRELVASRIGVDRLNASKDEHLNDIPLAQWDAFWVRHEGRGMFIVPPAVVTTRLQAANEGNSASTGTCILKEAARQVIEAAA